LNNVVSHIQACKRNTAGKSLGWEEDDVVVIHTKALESIVIRKNILRNVCQLVVAEVQRSKRCEFVENSIGEHGQFVLLQRERNKCLERVKGRGRK